MAIPKKAKKRKPTLTKKTPTIKKYKPKRLDEMTEREQFDYMFGIKVPKGTTAVIGKKDAKRGSRP